MHQHETGIRQIDQPRRLAQPHAQTILRERSEVLRQRAMVLHFVAIRRIRHRDVEARMDMLAGRAEAERRLRARQCREQCRQPRPRRAVDQHVEPGAAHFPQGLPGLPENAAMADGVDRQQRDGVRVGRAVEHVQLDPRQLCLQVSQQAGNQHHVADRRWLDHPDAPRRRRQVVPGMQQTDRIKQRNADIAVDRALEPARPCHARTPE